MTVVNLTVCSLLLEPRTQDSQGGPDDEDGDGEEQVSTHSGGEEEEAGVEEEEMSQWRGPGMWTNYRSAARFL